jgi:hypothetical protein
LGRRVTKRSRKWLVAKRRLKVTRSRNVKEWRREGVVIMIRGDADADAPS